jgi:phosphatidylglycerophosphate synthase
MHDSTDRRPIASRERRTWIALAEKLVAGNVSANAVSVAGMFFGIFCGVMFYLSSQTDHSRICLIAGAAFCQLRLMCNMLDGMVAIRSGKACPAGELYNEVPDRVSDSFALIGFGFVAGSSLILGFIAALLAMFTAYIRAVGKGAGAPQAFHGPMAKPHRMFLITLAALFFALAPANWSPVVWKDYSLASVVLVIVMVGCLITAVRRLCAITSSLNAIQFTHAAAEQREAAEPASGHS